MQCVYLLVSTLHHRLLSDGVNLLLLQDASFPCLLVKHSSSEINSSLHLHLPPLPEYMSYLRTMSCTTTKPSRITA